MCTDVQSDIQWGCVQTKAVYAERVFMKYLFNDGGRKAAGYKGTAGDCGARAMAIAMGLDYQAAYKELAQANANVGKAKSARNGIGKELYTEVLKKHGWVWKSAPKFDGRKARCSDMPSGVVIAHQAHHFVAVIDGVANDIFDCTHRMVYGYWAKA
jgi:hypothetical protein